MLSNKFEKNRTVRNELKKLKIEKVLEFLSMRKYSLK